MLHHLGELLPSPAAPDGEGHEPGVINSFQFRSAGDAAVRRSLVAATCSTT